jgi:hypothetical protein
VRVGSEIGYHAIGMLHTLYSSSWGVYIERVHKRERKIHYVSTTIDPTSVEIGALRGASARVFHG